MNQVKEKQLECGCVELGCGCIIGRFECPEYQRIHALQRDAYYRSDWEEYEKYRKQSWTHIGMEAPNFS